MAEFDFVSITMSTGHGYCNIVLDTYLLTCIFPSINVNVQAQSVFTIANYRIHELI